MFIQKYNERLRVLVIFILFFLFSCKSDSKKLRIACAANLAYTIEEIAEEFEKECDCEVEIVTASSGQHSNQILNGAPFDLFISANLENANLLKVKGQIDGAIQIFAECKLILWSYKHEVKGIEILESNDLKKVAVANPKTAPFGYAAMEFLSNTGIIQRVKPKLVFGESVSQTNLFLTSGSADIAITAKSAPFNPKLKTEGNWYEIDSDQYPPLLQCAAVIESSEKKALAKDFQKFLDSQTSRKILIKNGYDMP